MASLPHYDLCVIGGGPAGYAAAMRALDLGKTVLLVEKGPLGGAGLHDGALSSKTMWELSRDFAKVQHSPRGLRFIGCSVSYPEMAEVVHQAVKERRDQVEEQVDRLANHLVPDRFHFRRATARLLDAHHIALTPTDGPETTVAASHIILATGSRPRHLPNLPVDERVILTSDGILGLDRFPESLVIVGAGVIGCEFATIYANFGQTEVRLIDKANRILPFEDEDITAVVMENLSRLGVIFHSNARLEELAQEDQRVRYVLRHQDESLSTHHAAHALISIGRVPNVEQLGLKELGIAFDERGRIQVNDGQTSIPNIWAVGDLSADINLVNVGEVEGRHVVERIFLGLDEPMRYDNVSTIMFLRPEVAGVGLNEQQAQQRGIPYRVGSYSYRYINRAVAMRDTAGFFKILIADDGSNRVLGARAVGQHASSTVPTMALLIAQQQPVDVLADLIHPHPSITEGIQECVRMLLGKSIMKPEVFKDCLRCCRVYDGKVIESWTPDQTPMGQAG